MPWGIWESAAVFVLSLLAQALLFVAVAALGVQSIPIGVALPLSSALLAVTVVAAVALAHGRRAGLLFGFRRPSGHDLATGLGGGVAAYLVIIVGLGWLIQTLVRAAGGELPAVQEQFRRLASDPETAPLLLFSAIVVAPLAEEIFFRGMLFAALRQRVGVLPAIVASGLVFGVSHAETTLAANLLVIGIIFPIGMWLAWLYHRSGTLVVPVVAHAVYNAVQLLLFTLLPMPA